MPERLFYFCAFSLQLKDVFRCPEPQDKVLPAIIGQSGAFSKASRSSW